MRIAVFYQFFMLATRYPKKRIKAMNDEEILNHIRQSNHFKLLCETFKRMTELDLWLDSIDHDDPRSSEELSNSYYSILTEELNLKEQCELSHQEMRDASQGKHVKYATGISGLIHFLIPVRIEKREVGYLRCGGIRDSYRGVLKFMNFSQELKESHHDEDKITKLEEAFKKIPNLHGEDLAEASTWLAERAVEIEQEIENLLHD